MVDVVNGSSTSDYVTFFLNQGNLTLEALLTVFLLGLMRIAPIVSLAPFLGSKLPGGVKIGLAMSLSLLYIPWIIQTGGTPHYGFDLNFVAAGLINLLTGFIIAFLASIPFYIAQGSGTLIDYMRGASSLQVQDPTMSTQSSPIGILFNYILVVIFFNINGPFLFFDALTESFRILPIEKAIPTAFFNISLPFWKSMIGLLTRYTAISIQLSAPSIVSILMAEMFLGIANRLAPQVQIVFLGMSLKSLLGLGLLWAGWYFILQQMGKESLQWIKQIDIMLRSFGM